MANELVDDYVYYFVQRFIRLLVIRLPLVPLVFNSNIVFRLYANVVRFYNFAKDRASDVGTN